MDSLRLPLLLTRNGLLLRPREEAVRSIVISMSVFCPRAYLRNHTTELRHRDRDVVWGLEWWVRWAQAPGNHVLDGGPYAHKNEGAVLGDCSAP